MVVFVKNVLNVFGKLFGSENSSSPFLMIRGVGDISRTQVRNMCPLLPLVSDVLYDDVFVTGRFCTLDRVGHFNSSKPVEIFGTICYL